MCELLPPDHRANRTDYPDGCPAGCRLGKHAAKRTDIQPHRSSLSDAIPGVEKSDEFVAVVNLTLSDNRSNNRIESGAIAAASENSDTHVNRV